ncbi:MAG: hypothetical protein V4498_09615 [candidate division FCPU426 bacterium]
MKIGALGFFAAILLVHLALVSCAPPANPVESPAATATPGPTAVPTFAVVTSSGSTFVPNALTVPSGSVVKFNLASSHTVNIDDGSGGGVCSGVDLTSFPAYHTFSGASAQVFHIHCDVHSSCGASVCVGCTGMVMTVTIQ